MTNTNNSTDTNINTAHTSATRPHPAPRHQPLPATQPPTPTPNHPITYLDYSATSPLLPAAKQAMLTAMDLTGNPSALHTPGHLAHNLIEDARTKIARLINAHPTEILFTSGGTESNNTVLHIFAGQPVLISAIEHPSIIAAAQLHCQPTLLPVDHFGLVHLYTLHSALTTTQPSAAHSHHTATPQPKAAAPLQPNLPHSAPHHSSQPQLVSIMLANNEIGTIQDIKALAHLAHQHHLLFHTDATQALGKIPIDVKDLDVDYLTISSHKIGGPIGIGALYIKSGAPFTPLIVGGHQEHNRRAGTSQTINIAGFGAAAHYVTTKNLPHLYAEKIRPLRDHLAHRILTEIPFSSLNTPLPTPPSANAAPPTPPRSTPPSPSVKNALSTSASLSSSTSPRSTPSLPSANHTPPTLPHLLNVSFRAAEGESIQLYLDAEANIIVSTGSACASGDGNPSHVLMATSDNDAEIAHSSIRLSLGPDTTQSSLDHLMQHLPRIVRRLQQISTIPLPKTTGGNHAKP